MGVRRVVTGYDEEGRSVFASDEEVDPVIVALQSDAPFYRLWGSDATPTFPDDGSRPAESTFFPPVSGFRFGMFTVPPDTEAVEMPSDAETLGAWLAEMEEKLPGLLGHMELDDPGMHTSETIDFEVVLEGEVTLELDDGVEKVLGKGDTVVQNGTRHRWGNKGDVPATVAVFMVGARRK